MTENTDTFDRERWVRRQSALAEFGRQALMVDDLDALLHEAVVLAAQGLDIDRAKVMEALPGGDKLLMRAGTGWKPGLVGNLVVDAGSRSSGGFTLYTGKPVIAEDIENEKRFDVPDFLREHGIKSLINVIIQGKGEAFGVLEVDSTRAAGASTRRMSISCKATPMCWRRRSTATRPTTRWRSWPTSARSCCGNFSTG